MKIFKVKTLRGKLILSFLLMSVIPMIVVSAFGFFQSREMLAEKRAQSFGIQSRQLASMIENFVSERHGDALNFSLNPKLMGSPDNISAVANTYVRGYGVSDVVMVADINGVILGANTVNPEGDPIDTSHIIGKSSREDSWFLPYTNPETIKLGDVFVSDMEDSKLVAKATGGSGLGFFFTAPIFDENGKLSRVWIAQVSHARGVRRLLNEYRRFAAQEGANSVEVMLFSAKTGVVLDDTVEHHIFTENLLQSGFEEAKLASQGKSGYGLFPDPSGRAANGFASGYTLCEGQPETKSLGWAISVQEDLDAIWATADSLQWLALVAIVLVSFLVVGVSILLAKNIIKPIQRAVQTLLSASGLITDTSSQITRNTSHTSDQANAVSAMVEEISTNVGTIAVSMEQMNNAIKEISKNALDAQTVANSAVSVAEDTTVTIRKLGESSTEIGNVIKVINSIAEKTNLLALNATIEAARAGKAGKGFSVVANEVKELAKGTAKATEDISKKIEMIQRDTSSAINAITKFNGIIAQINDYQNTIASAVEEQTSTTGEISRSISEAATGTNDIARKVIDVAQAANESHSKISELQSSTGELSIVAGELRGLMSENELKNTNIQPINQQLKISQQFLSGTFGLGSIKYAPIKKTNGHSNGRSAYP